MDFNFNKNLKKFWGSNAKFREIKFYVNPTENNEIKVITQLDILNKIAKNVNNAIKSEEYRDLFLTANTGSGKSLLFQLPAIDLHENGFLTIVITPLIALMKDQVNSLKSKGISFATYLNSDDTYLEKETKINGIKEGKYSLIYVSPEFLVRYKNLSTLFNLNEKHKIGLYVIDEAHCVSTWGKGFRPDYWFIGKRFSNNWRKAKLTDAPILAITATAVNGGDFDSVGEIIKALVLKAYTQDEVILSYAKRDNIEIELSKQLEDYSKKKKEEAFVSIISELKNKYNKILIYHPYRRDSWRIKREIEEKGIGVEAFVGKMDKEKREKILYDFKEGNLKCVVATKAFGMGVDIKDIDCVCHYAINKSLTDYMQEIGRAGRMKESKAHAITYFNKKDPDYTKELNKLSGINQWQIKQILRKILEIYNKDHGNNGFKTVIVYPDSFYAFLTEDEEDERKDKKVETALLMIERDLLNKIGYDILSFDLPDTTEVFCFVNNENIWRLENTDYYEVFKKLSNSPMNGSIYELNLEEFWKKFKKDESLGRLKHDFFSGNLLEGIKIEPRIQIIANLKVKPKIAKDKIGNILGNIGEVFSSLSNQIFTEEIFIDSFKNKGFGKESIPEAILSFFSFEQEKGNLSASHKNDFKFIIKQPFGKFKLTQGTYEFYIFIESYFSRMFQSRETYDEFLSLGEANKIKIALGFLELFEILSFQVKGSENSAFSIFIKDPLKISTLLKNQYFNNEVLKSQLKREENELKLLQAFCNQYKNSDQAWDFLENYFLGRFSYSTAEIGLASKEIPETIEINTSDKSKSLKISLGEIIKHEQFGLGKVIEIKPEKNNEYILTVDFKKYSKRQFSTEYVHFVKATKEEIDFFENGPYEEESDYNINLSHSNFKFEHIETDVKIRPGFMVVIEDSETHNESTYYIEGIDAPFEKIDGNSTIRADSPLGKALLGHMQGDYISFKLPKSREKKRYKILEVASP